MKTKIKAKKYYVLAAKQQDGIWDIEFSDFDRECVQDELDSMYLQFKKKDLKIFICDDARQATIDKKFLELFGAQK